MNQAQSSVEQRVERAWGAAKSPRGAPWIFFVLLALMAASGCAALIYEIVWLQLLQLVIGSSAVSLGLLLGAYMGGLCGGSFLFARCVPRSWSPLRAFAALEAGIGVLGLLVLFGVPLVARLYAGAPGLITRGVVAAVCLLPPALLMGGSLPACARWAGTSALGVGRLGFLYSANIAGAVTGCLLAGFYLLRIHDMAVATFAAASINFAIASIAFLLGGAESRARDVPRETAAANLSIDTQAGANNDWLTYLAIALSGLTALGAEVVWTRLLSLLLGPTVYTFSIILAVFLLGLWAGSTAGSSLARRLDRPRIGLAACQILLTLALSWTAYTIAHSLPYWPVDPWLSLDSWFNFELDLARTVWAIFPATLLWGASFPLALASVTPAGRDPASLAGRVYGINTAGSIAGALAFSLWLIAAVGSRGSQQILIVLAIMSALLASASTLAPGRKALFIPAVAAAILGGWGLAAAVQDVPWQMIAYGRRIAPIIRAFDLYDQANPTKVLFRGEGLNSSVLIAERAGQRHFYVSGKAEASTALLDMRLERMMGHVPAMIHPAPRSALVVGFGAGVTAGSLTRYPELSKLVICELEPFIPLASDQYFGKENYGVLHDPRTRMVYDDARHYIFTTREKFDVITTDPIHPWVKGTSVLYSKEYYELVKRHLNPGGVVAQWLPIYDSDPDTIKTELATFFSVFPEGTIWSNNLNGDGFDLVLLGQMQKESISVDALQDRLDQPGYAPVLASLSDVGLHSAVELLATYAGRDRDLAPLLAGAQINQDLNMRLQYLAGLGLNSMAYQRTYKEILKYRRFPDDLLAGSPGGRMDALRTLLSAGR